MKLTRNFLKKLVEEVLNEQPPVPASPKKGGDEKETEKDLKRLFPKKSWNKLHLQIIYYGRQFCTARNCYGITCKICNTCYPSRKKIVKTKKA